MLTYLDWVIGNTKTKWWHDSAEPAELDLGLQRGAVGVTTNPFLSNLALAKHRQTWAAEIGEVMSQKLPAEQKAESLMRIVVTKTAKKLEPEFERSAKVNGYVCAQVNPSRAGDRDTMLGMAKRFSGWAPNIAVKLPATAAGLDVMEECVAQGITTTITVSFTVPQVVQVGARYQKAAERARQNGVTPGRCFAVIMIGRLDDYLREIAADTQAAVSEADIRQAGIAATKRAYNIYRERGYEAVLLIAALRGPYHLTELAGAGFIMSIAPAAQEWFVAQEHPREERIEREVPAEVVGRLRRMPEFVKAYEPDGMTAKEFAAYGVTQRTISQFIEAGWRLLEVF